MNETLRRLLAGASRLTRSGSLREATQAIQRALAARAPARAPRAERGGDVIDIDGAAVSEELQASRTDSFVGGHFSHPAGSRDYKLYVPPQAGKRPLPLIVMLHGCKQNPDDFAAGTRMNGLAREAGCFVLYPAQSSAANGSGCWNWFREQDQHSGRGEPAILAEMTREVMSRHSIDAARVFVAGLSAGGAMAATLAATYPDLYAAIGVHSGLPHRAAHDVVSAFKAMSQGARAPLADACSWLHGVPAIVFHGDQDATVHACNGERVATAARAAHHPASAAPRVEQGAGSGAGKRYTKSTYHDAGGGGKVEHWLVHGGGHAWFGGSPNGSFTDPSGPDASREMLRFFTAHPKAASRLAG